MSSSHCSSGNAPRAEVPTTTPPPFTPFHRLVPNTYITTPNTYTRTHCDCSLGKANSRFCRTCGHLETVVIWNQLKLPSGAPPTTVSIAHLTVSCISCGTCGTLFGVCAAHAVWCLDAILPPGEKGYSSAWWKFPCCVVAVHLWSSGGLERLSGLLRSCFSAVEDRIVLASRESN